MSGNDVYGLGEPSESTSKSVAVFTPHWCVNDIIATAVRLRAVAPGRPRQYAVDFNTGEGVRLYTKEQLYDLREQH